MSEVFVVTRAVKAWRSAAVAVARLASAVAVSFSLFSSWYWLM